MRLQLNALRAAGPTISVGAWPPTNAAPTITTAASTTSIAPNNGVSTNTNTTAPTSVAPISNFFHRCCCASHRRRHCSLHRRRRRGRGTDFRVVDIGIAVADMIAPQRR